MIARFDLTDAEYAVIEPLSPTDVCGKERVGDRRVLEGIGWRLRPGAPWADIPARYSPHTTCGNRFRRWHKRGIWDRLLDAVSEAYKGDLQMIDATSMRYHQYATSAQKRMGRPVCKRFVRGELTGLRQPIRSRRRAPAKMEFRAP